MNNSAPAALKLSRTTLKAQDNTMETSRITGGVYSHYRWHTTADSPSYITQGENSNPTEFNLPLLHKVASKRSGSPPNRADSWRHLKRRNSAARREDQSQNYRAFEHRAFESMAQTPNRNKSPNMTTPKQKRKKNLGGAGCDSLHSIVHRTPECMRQ